MSNVGNVWLSITLSRNTQPADWADNESAIVQFLNNKSVKFMFSSIPFYLIDFSFSLVKTKFNNKTFWEY